MNQAMENNPLNLMRYWHLIRGKLWHILALTMVVSSLAAIVVTSMKPVYQSTGVLLLEPEQAASITLADLFYIDARGSAYTNTQKEIIRSGRVLNTLVEELQLDQLPEFGAVDETEQTSWVKAMLNQAEWLKSLLMLEDGATEAVNEIAFRQIVINAVRDKLKIIEVPKSKLIQLKVESNSADLAANMVNTLARIYIQNTLQARMDMARQASAWMRERTDSLKVQLSVAENRLQSFVEAEGLVQLDKSVNSLSSKELTEQSNRARQAKAKVTELSQRYGSKHPKLRAARTELAQARRAMQSGKSMIQTLGRTDIKLKELQREVDTTRDLYRSYLTRVKETDESSTLKTATARVIDKAVAPRYPIKPKKKLIVAAAFFITLFVGIGLVLLLDMLNATIRSVEEVGLKLGMPLLGLVPLLKFKQKKASREQMMREMTGGDSPHFSEAIRTIRTGIMLSAIDKPHKTILVTSSLPGEGKSTVATNLAIALGKMEKVLLIDADMRRPTIKKHIGLETMEMGLSELVADTAKLKETICQNSEFGIDVIHAGMIPPNPLELLASKRFSTVMDAFEKHYDRIIIDSTPIQAVSDALVLSKHASGLVYVIKSDSTSEHAIKACLKRLREVDAPIIGVVLNQVDVKKKGKYGYGYGGYYDQYGYSSNEKT